MPTTNKSPITLAALRAEAKAAYARGKGNKALKGWSRMKKDRLKQLLGHSKDDGTPVRFQHKKLAERVSKLASGAEQKLGGREAVLKAIKKAVDKARTAARKEGREPSHRELQVAAVAALRHQAGLLKAKAKGESSKPSDSAQKKQRSQSQTPKSKESLKNSSMTSTESKTSDKLADKIHADGYSALASMPLSSIEEFVKERVRTKPRLKTNDDLRTMSQTIDTLSMHPPAHPVGGSHVPERAARLDSTATNRILETSHGGFTDVNARDKNGGGLPDIVSTAGFGKELGTLQDFYHTHALELAKVMFNKLTVKQQALFLKSYPSPLLNKFLDIDLSVKKHADSTSTSKKNKDKPSDSAQKKQRSQSQTPKSKESSKDSSMTSTKSKTASLPSGVASTTSSASSHKPSTVQADSETHKIVQQLPHEQKQKLLEQYAHLPDDKVPGIVKHLRQASTTKTASTKSGDLDKMKPVKNYTPSYDSSSGIAYSKAEPSPEDLLHVVHEVDAKKKYENYVPIHELRDAFPNASRSHFDKTLYKLQRQNDISLSTLAEPRHYTDKQLDAGIEQIVSGNLFFISSEHRGDPFDSGKKSPPESKKAPSLSVPDTTIGKDGAPYQLTDVSSLSGGKAVKSDKEIERVAQHVIHHEGKLSTPVIAIRKGVDEYQVAPDPLNERLAAAARKAKELDPKSAEMVNTYVAKNQKEAEALLYQRHLAGLHSLDKVPTFGGKSEFQRIDVKSIVGGNKPEDLKDHEIENLAHSHLRVGNILPLVVRHKGDGYEMVSGDAAIAGARRAREIDPRRGEMVNAFVVSGNNVSNTVKRSHNDADVVPLAQIEQPETREKLVSAKRVNVEHAAFGKKK